MRDFCMKRKRMLFVTIGVTILLLSGMILYSFLLGDDPHRYYTGLGESISLSFDDSKLTFSYYENGKESIYMANPDGTNVQKITNPTNLQHRSPKFSPSGDKIVYLSEDQEGIQSLRTITLNKSKDRELTDEELHVKDAIFSRDGDNIYFVAVEAEEFKKGENSKEGFDLFSIETAGGQITKLTDADHFSMNHLFLSPDGKTIYYNEVDGEKERIYAYSIEDKTRTTEPSFLPKEFANTYSFYEAELSLEEKHLAFTDVSQESQSFFEYELYILDLASNKIEKLTNFRKAVTSIEFFHKGKKVAFLESTNWPKEPDKFTLKTIDLVTQKLETIQLDAPKTAHSIRLIHLIDQTINGFTIACLYILLVILLSIFFQHYHTSKVYLPSIISFSIAVIIFMSSIAVAVTINPWYGIGIGILAGAIFGCSIVAIIFIFIYKRIVK